MKEKREQAPQKEPIDWKKEAWEWVKIIATAAVIAFVLNTFIIANSKVPSGSMENTIMTKDRIIGSRLTYLFDEPERGDIVIFDHATGPGREKTRLVKRIIGMPGETVDIRDGRIYINGSDTPLDEPYLPEPMEEEDMHFEIEEGCYFMLGDNRNHSADARGWFDHNVPKEEIIAKVYFRYYPRIGRIQ